MADDGNYGGDDDGGLAEREAALKRKMQSYTAPKQVLDDVPMEEAGGDGEGGDPFAGRGLQRVVDRESDYHRRRLARALSPSRADAFSADATKKTKGGKGKKGEESGGGEPSSYADVMRAAALARERDNTLANIRAKERAKEAGEAAAAAAAAAAQAAGEDKDGEKPSKKARTSEWDDDEGAAAVAAAAAAAPRGSLPAGAPSAWDATPVAPSASAAAASASASAAALPRRPRSRWDETPVGVVSGGATPAANANFFGATPVAGSGGRFGATPVISSAGPSSAAAAAATAAASSGSMTAEQFHALKVERDLGGRNRPWTGEELDSLLPGPSDGYKVCDPPKTYVPIMTPARKLSSSAPAPLAGTQEGFFMSDQQAVGGAGSAAAAAAAVGIDLLPAIEGLPELRPEDAQYFGKLLAEVDEDELTLEEAKERRIMKLLLKVKNGTPQQRKSALRTLGDKSREFGAGPLFNQILPLLMSPALDDQERHVLVKVVDRVLRKLDELVRPYVHKVLVVVEPLLIDEDYYARIEGREIVANLAKAAGLATMIAAMRPDIDAVDEYVRNTTARAFAVVASALGVPALLPFLKAVCRSKKSWQARHTGIKIVQQTAILLGCGVLPHLGSLVAVVAGGLSDADAPKVRTMAGLALAALAEAAAPYGIDAFDDVLEPLWKGVRLLRGKALAAYLKAIGNIIPLMDATYANYYTREVMVVLLREFASPDDEMKRIVLKVVAQCVGADGVPSSYVRDEVLPGFFEHFWVRRMALDRRAYKAVLETTVEVARKVGGACVLSRIVEDLKDEAEPYRRLVMDAIRRILREQGAADVDARLEELLVDGALYAYQEQGDDDGDEKSNSASAKIVLDGFGAIVSSLGRRAKPYLAQVCGTVKWRLNNRAPRVRAQAADLVAAVAPTMASCGEDKLLSHLGVVLFEYLGEEFPDVLASILGALGAIVAVVYSSGESADSVAEKMQPPVRDLLPRLTPILKNRHERVQERCVDLVGRIADRAAEGVPAREWMRVCFELLELLKAPKLAVRRAAVSTFGFIARAIGPQDVLVALLNNLKVQERQMRVCTTVAIAVVAEACGPFTVLPALMNEYRTPENNVQNGVLKATSFLFEYVGRAGSDYVDAITPLLADALADRDAVHRQTAAAALGHVALGVANLGREDALVHLLNLLWPNIFETAPHVARAVSFAVEALRLALGPGVALEYLLQGLFHPARRVRETYWRLYNSLYVGSAAALVAFYPQLDAVGPQEGEGGKKNKGEEESEDDEEDDEEDEDTIGAPVFSAPSYRRTVLDVFI